MNATQEDTRTLLKEAVEAAASESSIALAEVSKLVVKAARIALVALEPVNAMVVCEERLVDVRIWSLDNVPSTREFLDACGLVETDRRRTMASYGYASEA